MSEEDQPPALPRRPANEPPPPPKAQTPPAPPPPVPEPEPISDFWSNEQAKQQQEYEEQQRRLQQQWEAQIQQQQMEALRQQHEFEEAQRQQMEAQRLAQDQLVRDQFARQTQGQLADMEQQLLAMKGQWDRDQVVLQHYDTVGKLPPKAHDGSANYHGQTIKNLENELAQLRLNSQQQLVTKDEMIKSLQGQCRTCALVS